jgi:hypothetical protein
MRGNNKFANDAQYKSTHAPIELKCNVTYDDFLIRDLMNKSPLQYKLS